MKSILSILLLASCGSGAAQPVHPNDELEPHGKPTCQLPVVPRQPKMVGWPTGTEVYLTISDLTELLQYQAAVATWIEATTSCLTEEKVIPKHFEIR